VSGRAYLVVVAATLMLLVVILRLVRRRRLRPKYALLWLAFGAAILPFALIPSLLDRLARLVGVEYGPALLLVLGLGFFALVSLHFSSELSRMEERTRTLGEEIALLRDHITGGQLEERRRERDPLDPGR
jgi:hypothetical protein